MAESITLTPREAQRVLVWLDESPETDEVCIPTLGECHGAYNPEDLDCQICTRLRLFLGGKEKEE